jgi:hypothetical protein
MEAFSKAHFCSEDMEIQILSIDAPDFLFL